MIPMPLAFRRNSYFMHDGAPAHFERVVRDYLNRVFENNRIGRGGPVHWPPRSPDLISLISVYYLKTLVYQNLF